MSPTPTRLRNGKVAIVLTAQDVSAIRDSIRQARKAPVVSLNAISGFESGIRKRNWHFALLLLIAVPLLCLFVIPKERSLATQSEVTMHEKPIEDLCKREVRQGDQIVGALNRLGKVSVSGNDYIISSIRMLGGLAQIQLKRSCDKTYLRIDAWFDGELLRVAKIY